jgi:hypothetical protein
MTPPSTHPTAENEFTDDEDSFVLMTPAATQSQHIASLTAASPSGFRKRMLNMLGDRLRKVPKNCQLRSPFQSKGQRPHIPCTKALALMKKIQQDPHLER